MELRADLHIHTTASDGVLAPARAVEIAAEMGLAAIAITDHDTVDGVAEALEAGARLGIEVVSATEISATHAGKIDVHVLGYFIDHLHPDLMRQLSSLKNARRERGRRMVEQLNAAGVPIRFERVVEIAGDGAIGRPHVAKALCEMGAVSSMDSAFGRYLQEGCPGFVARYKVEPAEAIRIVRAAGGVACLGHVAKLKCDDLVVELIGLGLAAIEVYHPDHTRTGTRFYDRFARERGLVATGGSDAHGFEPERHGGIGCVTVPIEVVHKLRAAAAGAGSE